MYVQVHKHMYVCTCTHVESGWQPLVLNPFFQIQLLYDQKLTEYARLDNQWVSGICLSLPLPHHTVMTSTPLSTGCETLLKQHTSDGHTTIFGHMTILTPAGDETHALTLAQKSLADWVLTLPVPQLRYFLNIQKYQYSQSQFC